MEDELAGLEGAVQLADQQQPVAAVVVAGGEVDLVARVHALGLVHRYVCPLEQPQRVARVLREERDADAGVHVDADAADGERPLERRAQPQPGGTRGGLVARRQHDGELVASEPRERVLLPQDLRESRPDLPQHLVPRRVAERVVELSEAVEVDEQERQRSVPRGRRLDGPVEPVDEVAPVAEPCEVVRHRLVMALAQAGGHGQTGARHPRQHRGDGQGDRDLVKLGELADAEQDERGQGAEQDRGQDDAAELGSRLGRRLAQPRRAGQPEGGERRPDRAEGQPAEPSDRHRQRPPGLPAAQGERPDRAAGCDSRRGVATERDGERRHGRTGQRRVEPREQRDRRQAVEHQGGRARRGERAGDDQAVLEDGRDHRRRERERSHRDAPPDGRRHARARAPEQHHPAGDVDEHHTHRAGNGGGVPSPQGAEP